MNKFRRYFSFLFYVTLAVDWKEDMKTLAEMLTTTEPGIIDQLKRDLEEGAEVVERGAKGFLSGLSDLETLIL